MKYLKKIFSFFWNLSIGQIYRSIFKRKKKLVCPTIDFLKSSEYNQIMNEFLPYTLEFGLFEASTYTKSYINRHHKYFHKLGVFRWRGLQENLSLILPIISDKSKKIIDFGGGGCPLGMGSILIDQLKKDVIGKKILYHNLNDYKENVDVIFACHVLEHIKNLEDVLIQIRNKLKKGGYLICMVPSFSNKFWNAGIHKNEKFGGHAWTFGLSETSRDIIHNYFNYLDIDTVLNKYLKIEKATYCGDNSIFVIARNL